MSVSRGYSFCHLASNGVRTVRVCVRALCGAASLVYMSPAFADHQIDTVSVASTTNAEYAGGLQLLFGTSVGMSDVAVVLARGPRATNGSLHDTAGSSRSVTDRPIWIN